MLGADDEFVLSYGWSRLVRSGLSDSLRALSRRDKGVPTSFVGSIVRGHSDPLCFLVNQRCVSGQHSMQTASLDASRLTCPVKPDMYAS